MTTTATQPKIDELSINTIRFLSVDAVEKANSGHPGTPMALAPIAYVLWTKFLKHNPQNPYWPNRDRFVLSAGHASMLLYSMLHLCGYNLSLNDLKDFRQWGSKTPGHPEYGHTEGVETTTGPLGQGISTAVGMAIAQRYLNSLFQSDANQPLLDYKIYGIASDGDLMEGISHEASSLAGHLGLSSMIFFYDNNHITIDGQTELAFSEDVRRRYESYNWNVLTIADANNLTEISNALESAQKETARPTLIITRSHIGYGSPKVDSAEAHGAPLGAEDAKASKNTLEWPQEPTFFVPEEVKKHFEELMAKGAGLEESWNETFDAWSKKNPEALALWNRLEKQELPKGWEAKLPDITDEKLSTRAASGKVLNAMAPIMPELLGGSADLAPSNNTYLKGYPSFSKSETGRNFHFGIREHAMSAALNGIALSEMLIPYGGTFLIFSDYMKGAMRLSALMKQQVVYVLTHDSIGLGEDGPTHQPIEQLAHLRAIPNMTVIRPADANETVAAWAFALQHKNGPVSLILTRQNIPVLAKAQYPQISSSVSKGGYVLKDSVADPKQLRLIFIATGSEVSLALGAQKKLAEENIHSRVVSMPSTELFDQQPQSYRDSVLIPKIRKRISIEALSTFGWDRYVGLDGAVIGMASFGASAPGPVAMEKFGFTVDNVLQRARKLIQ